MRYKLIIGSFFVFLCAGQANAQRHVLIKSRWGDVTAELNTTAAARKLAGMLPLTITMRDHLRQEKTGNLPSALPRISPQVNFSKGTLGLWGADHFVIYYQAGQVPQPGIVILGKATGDISIFDRPGPVVIELTDVK